MKILKKIVIALFVILMLFLAMAVTMPTSYLTPKPQEIQVPSPPPPAQASDPKLTLEAKLSVANIIDIEWSEGNSWSTVFKLLVIVLGTFLGIKTINAVFRRFE
jgi:hypothetical protein